MPDPFERHGRNSWEWGPSPARGQTRAAAADQGLTSAKRSPGKKDKDLCKAVHWKGPHTWALRIRQIGWRRTLTCKWALSWSSKEPAWYCNHETFCAGCGKVRFESVSFEDCPDSHPMTEGERVSIELEREKSRERSAKRNARRPEIKGPQGYRKVKKEDG